MRRTGARRAHNMHMVKKLSGCLRLHARGLAALARTRQTASLTRAERPVRGKGPRAEQERAASALRRTKVLHGRWNVG